MNTKKFHYVYRITNTKINKHYYGVRSSKTEPSKDLGIKYFSSSSNQEFKNDQRNNPQDYKYKIVSIFNSREDAILYEIKLHSRFNVGSNEAFYNKSKQTSVKWDTLGTTFTLSEEARNKISKALKNKPKSKRHIENLILNHGMKGKKHTTSAKRSMSINRTGDKNGMYGRNHTPESIKKMKESSANPNDEIRENLRKGWKKRKYITCPVCGLESNNAGNMTRWHFDNCNKKP